MLSSLIVYYAEQDAAFFISVDEILSFTIQMKTTEQSFSMVLFISLYFWILFLFGIRWALFSGRVNNIYINLNMPLRKWTCET